MYPLLRGDVSLGTYYNSDKDEEGFFAENGKGHFYNISEDIFNALLVADGRHPWDVGGSERDEVIAELEKIGIIQTRRFVWSGLINRFVVIPTVRPDEHMRRFFCILNKLLPKAACLLFLAGVFSRNLVPMETSEKSV